MGLFGPKQELNDEVFQQMEEVRASGAVNMFDSHGVKREASQRHLQKLVNAINDHGFGNVLQQFGVWKRRQEDGE